MTQAPILTDGDITLRHHTYADFARFLSFYASERARFVDNPELNETRIWYGFASEVGSWSLQGMGGWGIDVGGETAGQVAVSWQPHWANRELGWILFDGFEGRGIATRAATLARDWAIAAFPGETLVSYIDYENSKSIAVAERLGAIPDATLKAHDPRDVVYRHVEAA